MRELDAEKILCISDTTDVLLKDHQTTASVAHCIEKASLGPRLEVIQSDFMSFRPELCSNLVYGKIN